MKKYNVRLVSLILFTGIFSSNLAIGMDLPELSPRVLGGEEPSFDLLPEIKKIIVTKVLRLVLDEVEDNPKLLLSREKLKSLTGIFIEHVLGGQSLERYASENNIDVIIRLLMLGADPNTKSYKGKTVLHLLIATLQGNWINRILIDALELKIQILSKYININVQNSEGNTIGHELIKLYVQKTSPANAEIDRIYDFILFLFSALGLDMTIIKNNNEQTPMDLGNELIISAINNTNIPLELMRKEGEWMRFLRMFDQSTARYYGEPLFLVIQKRLRQINQ